MILRRFWEGFLGYLGSFRGLKTIKKVTEIVIPYQEGSWRGFGRHFRRSWRAFGRSLVPLGGLLGGLWGHVGVLGDGFGGFGSRWETFLRPWRYFAVLREGFRGFRSYFTGFKRFPQCFYWFASMLQVYRGFHSVFAAMASKASEDPLGPILAPNWDHLGPKLVQQLQVSSAIPTNFY